ncbi:late competence development ComFB family protein [Sessilibacter sp. MAH4]
MLLQHSSSHTHLTALDSIHNYYEKLVIDEIRHQSERARLESDFLADVACVSLNHLPPRYIRYDVDMTFFLSPQEQKEIQDKVKTAVHEAITYVSLRARPPEEEPVKPQATSASQAQPVLVNTANSLNPDVPPSLAEITDQTNKSSDTASSANANSENTP